MHFNVKNVLQLDEALHELPIHDSGITSIENEVGNNQTSDVNAEIDMEAVPIVVIGAE